MTKFALTTTLIMLSGALTACSPAEAPVEAAQLPPPVIEGVWRASQVRIEAGPYTGSHSLDVQPSVYIFADDHYAISAVDGFAARSFLGSTPSITETGRAYQPFTGQTGTYTSENNRIVLSPLVTKDPALMNGSTEVSHDLSWVDGDVWLTGESPSTGRTMTRLTRVTDDGVTQTPAELRLQGVWRRVEKIVDRGPETGRHLEDMQPGYYIFAGDKFVANFVTAFAPRPLLPEEPTDEELGLSFGPFSSFGGHYDINADGALVLWPAVTLDPNNMRGRPFQSIDMEWQDDGDVWFVYTSTDGAQNRTRLTKVSD